MTSDFYARSAHACTGLTMTFQCVWYDGIYGLRRGKHPVQCLTSDTEISSEEKSKPIILAVIMSSGAAVRKRKP
jgi:hypothetical protein